MYEQFGASGHQGHTVFKLFVPDRDIDPVYSGSGGSPRIASVHALGDHQTTLNEQAWVPSDTTLMHEVTHPNGRLYQLDLGDQLPDGFYQYKYRVTFQNGTTRAERALRHGVMHRKLTQGTRGDTGQRWIERMLSVRATCKQQSRSFFGYLVEAIEAHTNGRPSPALLA